MKATQFVQLVVLLWDVPTTEMQMLTLLVIAFDLHRVHPVALLQLMSQRLKCK